MTTSAEQFYGRFGFEKIDTGGGCTAFRKQGDFGLHVLITAQDDAVVPEEAAQPVTIGLYTEEGAPLGVMTAPDGDAAMHLLSSGRWGTPEV